MKIKPVAEFPKYSVDDQGFIYNAKGRKLKSGSSGKYRTATFRDNGTNHSRQVKDIVAEAFVKKPSEFHSTVVHINDDFHDDRAENLKWAIGYSEKAYENLIGQKFNKLTILAVVWCCNLWDKENGSSEVIKSRLLCQCDCGNYTTIEKTNVIEGGIKSCGCICKEAAKERKDKYGVSENFEAVYKNQRAEKVKQIESYGWKIKGEYKNLDTPTTLICKNGHETTLRLHTWNSRSEERKSVCSECEKKEKECNVLAKFGQLQLDAIAQGYSVNQLGDKALELICSSGHKKVVNSTSNIKDCRECKYDSMHKNKRDRLELILNKTGYTITEYQKNKITYKCVTCDDSLQVVGLSIQNLIRKGKSSCQRCKVVNSVKATGYKLLSEYTGSQEPLRLMCPEGHITESTTWNSWKAGKRCIMCHMAKFGDVVEEFLNQVKEEGYTLLEDYVNRRAEIPCICPQGHEWKVSRVNWQGGIRCRYCNPGGFNTDRPGLLYYLKVNYHHIHLYKIGITNASVQARYRGEKATYEVLMEKWYENGQEAFDKEQSILQEYQRYKYTGDKVLTCGGNTELFVVDVLGLDSKVETSMSA